MVLFCNNISHHSLQNTVQKEPGEMSHLKVNAYHSFGILFVF